MLNQWAALEFIPLPFSPLNGTYNSDNYNFHITSSQTSPLDKERRRESSRQLPRSPQAPGQPVATWRLRCMTPWDPGLPTTSSSAGHAISSCQATGRNATPDLATRSSSRPLPRPCLSSYHQVSGTRNESNGWSAQITSQYSTPLSPFLQWSSMAAILLWPAPCLPAPSPPTPRPATPRPAETFAQLLACCARPSPSIGRERSTASPSGPSEFTSETATSTAFITLFG